MVNAYGARATGVIDCGVITEVLYQATGML
jgi:hypothetical protein